MIACQEGIDVLFDLTNIQKIVKSGKFSIACPITTKKKHDRKMPENTNVNSL